MADFQGVIPPVTYRRLVRFFKENPQYMVSETNPVKDLLDKTADLMDDQTINNSNPIVILTGVTATISSANFAVDETAQITPSTQPANASGDHNFSYVSSDEAIATVDVSGLVTGVAAGTADITVSTGGFNTTVSVTIS
jgi:uncharacterized protein YjdB